MISWGRKIQMTYFILRQEHLDIGNFPYQDFHCLKEIRNRLVHQRPERISLPDAEGSGKIKSNSLVDHLANRQVIARSPKDQPKYLLVHLRNPKVATWAYNVTIQMVKMLTGILPSSGLKDTATFLTTSLEEVS